MAQGAFSVGGGGGAPGGWRVSAAKEGAADTVGDTGTRRSPGGWRVSAAKKRQTRALGAVAVRVACRVGCGAQHVAEARVPKEREGGVSSTGVRRVQSSEIRRLQASNQGRFP